MHRGFALGWALVLILALTGCAERITGEDVYAFPDSVSEITVHGYGMGRMTSCVLREEEDILPVLRWYEALELQPMDAAPEAAEGNQAWEFTVNGEAAFTYDDRGGEAYLVMGDKTYRVRNPAQPPVECPEP